MLGYALLSIRVENDINMIWPRFVVMITIFFFILIKILFYPHSHMSIGGKILKYKRIYREKLDDVGLVWEF